MGIVAAKNAKIRKNELKSAIVAAGCPLLCVFLLFLRPSLLCISKVSQVAFVYCLNTSTIQPVPLLDKIRLASEAGFQAIELWLNDVFDYLERGGKLSDVTQALDDHGLQRPSTIAMKGWGDATEDEYPRALDECRRRMALAVELGATYLVATPPRGPANLEQLAARYRDLLRLGRDAGIRPAMEYLGFCQSVYRVDQAWQIVQAADNPMATLVIDSFHTFRGGSSLADLQAIPVERIAHVHLDDAPTHPPREEQMDPDRVMPGDGILDLRSEIAWLRRIGYQGAVSLELFNPTLWQQDPRTVLQLGIERMRELLN
jgi:sugar phosphate isomerase/epimerase